MLCSHVSDKQWFIMKCHEIGMPYSETWASGKCVPCFPASLLKDAVSLSLSLIYLAFQGTLLAKETHWEWNIWPWLAYMPTSTTKYIIIIGSLGLPGNLKGWSCIWSLKILSKKQLLRVASIVSSALSVHEEEIKQACEKETKGEVFFMLWTFSYSLMIPLSPWS